MCSTRHESLPWPEVTRSGFMGHENPDKRACAGASLAPVSQRGVSEPGGCAGRPLTDRHTPALTFPADLD